MQSGTSTLDTTLQRIESTYTEQHLHGITVILPDVPKISDAITGYFDDYVYYHISNLPAYQLVESEFLETFIKKGCLEARTINVWADVDDTIVLQPSGLLEISVGKDLYQELGLIGQPQLLLGRQIAKYFISINLLDENFQPGSKMHKRVVWCLKERLDLQFNWIIKWKPHDSEICPSSLAAYLDLNKFTVKQCKPKTSLNRLYNLSVPVIEDGETLEMLDLVEWVGAASLNIECPIETCFSSSMTCPEPRINVGQVAVLSWRGFFSVSETMLLFTTVNNFLKETYGPPWFNISLHGFDDAIVKKLGPPCPMLTSIFMTPSSKCHWFSLSSPTNKIK